MPFQQARRLKYALTFIEADGTETQKDYHKLTDIIKDYPRLTYHQIRQNYLQSTGKKINRLHDSNRQLFDRMKIVDIPQLEF
jgi:hypothetical protein